MKSMTASATIAAPAREIFDVIADLEQHSSFAADELEVRRLTGEGSGATYESRAVARGRTFDAASTVITKQPPEHFGFRAEDVSGTFRHRKDVTATNNGCRVTRTVTPVHLPPGQPALYWLVL